MIKTLTHKNISIVCPKNRVDNYLAYCAHVFKIKKVKFFQEIKLLEHNTDILFIDQKNLVTDRINLLFKKKISLLVILLWNSDRDYFTYKSKIILLKKNLKFNYFLYQIFQKIFIFH